LPVHHLAGIGGLREPILVAQQADERVEPGAPDTAVIRKDVGLLDVVVEAASAAGRETFVWSIKI
jgi:hypothetical protein